MTTPDVQVMATEYAVCALPEDHPWFYHYVIKVVRVPSTDQWMVTDGSDRFDCCLGADGEWTYADGTRGWRDAHRFDRDTALALAKAAAPNIVTGNNLTVADALSRTETAR